MGNKLWAAFECAALADVTGNAKEGQRLFDIGYNQGRLFVEAVQAGKVAEQDINGKVPLAVLLLLRRPSQGAPTFQFSRLLFAGSNAADLGAKWRRFCASIARVQVG
jgi:hypothetical protein